MYKYIVTVLPNCTYLRTCYKDLYSIKFEIATQSRTDVHKDKYDEQIFFIHHFENIRISATFYPSLLLRKTRIFPRTVGYFLNPFILQ